MMRLLLAFVLAFVVTVLLHVSVWLAFHQVSEVRCSRRAGPLAVVWPRWAPQPFVYADQQGNVG